MAFLLVHGTLAKNVLWNITNSPRVDATSENSIQYPSEVKGQMSAFHT